jgi:hypothetical protein
MIAKYQPLGIERHAEGLAERIRTEIGEANRCGRSAVEHAVEAGKLLLEARELVPHGRWGTRVQGNCRISPGTPGDG